MALKEYKPGTAFPGVIGRTFESSEPAWPEPRRARQGAPNVVFIVLDDTGFGQLGSYGSPIRTPNFDRLASDGIRLAAMHTTALCSPTRACILTGRNHHSNGLACITEGSTGYPGSNAVMPFENGMLSEILLEHGYNTYCVGKWHLTPPEQTTAAGPFDRWPLGRGFERFYGFLGGDTHQYYPDLIEDNREVDQPSTPEEGYHLTPDLVDHAIEMIASAKQVAPDKPFFLYLATGAMHAPHHVPKEWIDRYRGAFDGGWDRYREQVFARQKELGLVAPDTTLSGHDPDVQDWDALSEEERRLYARMMEVFAGFLEHTDHHIGRLLGYLEETGQRENTMVVVISDNGASAEGGPHGSINENLFFNNVPESLEENLAAIDELGGPKHFNHYPWGWTWAGNTPFRRWKRETYRGGVSDPCIVSWPKGLAARGEVRAQFAHAIDIVPTVLDLLEVEPPDRLRGVTQSPLEGVSMRGFLDDRNAPSAHRTQYFEMLGHRSLYHEGWRAVCPIPGPSYAESGLGFGELLVTEDKLRELDRDGWELYHVAEDPAETRNLAREERGRLIEMIALWYVEAGKYDVLPLDSRTTLRFADERPQLAKERRRYVLRPHTASISEVAAPRILNRPHSITARVALADREEGVLVAQGGSTGGFSLFLQDGKLHYVHNYVGAQEFHVETPERLPKGEHEVRFEFEPTGRPDLARGKGAPGRAQLYVDGKLWAQGELPVTVPLVMSIGEGLSCGRDGRSPVTERYRPPFEFEGELREVVVEVGGELIEDKAAEVRRVMARE